jgi:hypothetical protein
MIEGNIDYDTAITKAGRAANIILDGASKRS